MVAVVTLMVGFFTGFLIVLRQNVTIEGKNRNLEKINGNLISNLDSVQASYENAIKRIKNLESEKANMMVTMMKNSLSRDSGEGMIIQDSSHIQ